MSEDPRIMALLAGVLCCMVLLLIFVLVYAARRLGYKGMSIQSIGEGINDTGREFKYWFTEFTLVYSPIFIVLGLILTGIDLFLNLGISGSLWFRVPWSLAQLFAVDGLWFAVWNRILTDDYTWRKGVYHFFIILIGVCMTGIAIVMNYIVFTQDYMKLSDSIAAMRYIGIPVGIFLGIRSILLMATATLAIVLDKVLREKKRKPKVKPVVQEGSTTSIQEVIPPTVLIPQKSTRGYKESIRVVIVKFNEAGIPYTNKDIAEAIPGVSLQTVKTYAPKIKRELKDEATPST
jgi:hypothetical protein